MPPKKHYNLPKQKSFKDKLIYYCSNCKCECLALKAPIIENKVTDKIEVTFD